ncbi:MAG: hypothetical protein U5Q16_14430 [Gammaproteobacteria bacterium]|nr:hypothetical protein [Gammaproteobacteria bacterium]
MPDQDRDRYVHQARREGLSLSAWLRAAAEDRLNRQAQAGKFESVEDLQAFFVACDTRAGDGEEPDWAEHRSVIEASRRRGASET